jgi:pyruvate/2-oxoglutarate dehydrogenase complex dihydrolipoamide acyltransferase (E2) component
MFIDTLEMLADKTRGNLTKIEQELLQHSLTELRMHFVEAVDRAPTASAPAPAPEPAAPSAPADAAAKPPAQPEAQEPAPPAADSRKKYVKKY